MSNSWLRFLLHYSTKQLWKDIMQSSVYNQHCNWHPFLLFDDPVWKIWKWLEEDSPKQANINVSFLWSHICLHSPSSGNLEIHFWPDVPVGLLCTGEHIVSILLFLKGKNYKQISNNKLLVNTILIPLIRHPRNYLKYY